LIEGDRLGKVEREIRLDWRGGGGGGEGEVLVLKLINGEHGIWYAMFGLIKL